VDYDDAGAFVGRERSHGCDSRLDERRVECIEHLRPIEGKHGDVTFVRHAKGLLIRHARAP
jgi:hypothetical protein